MGDWKPIETMPENRKVLLCRKHDREIEIGQLTEAPAIQGERWAVQHGQAFRRRGDGYFSAWMPLPEPPRD